MSQNKIPSSLDITCWFCAKAESSNVRLTDKKIQHLLFLAQINHLAKHKCFLFPSMFVCDNNGFSDPTITTIMQHGLPLMSSPKLSPENTQLLEAVWHKYSPLSDAELHRFITSLDCYKHNYKQNCQTIINPACMVDTSPTCVSHSPNSPKSKIMISQNGPVKVSAWSPRKLCPPKN